MCMTKLPNITTNGRTIEYARVSRDSRTDTIPKLIIATGAIVKMSFDAIIVCPRVLFNAVNAITFPIQAEGKISRGL